VLRSYRLLFAAIKYLGSLAVMKFMGRWAMFVGVILMFALASQIANAQLLTIEEAQKLSKATGRPILAMAGSKT
jgi:hypothetical protein